MWSGPRNISTALMRSWENRADCRVVDEPFYAHYLEKTGLEHPGRDAVLRSQPRDWQFVVRQLLAPLDADVAVHYQKHMAHHLLPGMEGDWLGRLTHAFLIRDPREMVASYVERRETVSVGDLGVERQADLWRYVADRFGYEPVVIDCRDVLADPERMLRALCGALAVRFDPAMLSWPPGPRDSDGVWAPWWYDAVRSSTGFRTPSARPIELDAAQESSARSCQAPYRFLHDRRLIPAENCDGGHP